MIYHEIRELPPRDKWFRLPEREHVKTDILKLNAGSWIETKRVIIRAGYYYQPFDMPMELLEERMKQHVMVSMNDYGEPGLYPYNPDYPLRNKDKINPWGTFTDKHYELLGKVFQDDIERIGKQLYYRLRGEWMYDQKKSARTDKDRDKLWFKTFWYVDLNQSDSYQIQEYKRKQCGAYSSGGGGYYGDDYDPPYLAASVVQTLYLVSDVYNNGHYESIYVHPLDCKQDRSKYL